MPRRWTRELLDVLEECDVFPYRSSGPGGQKKNKTESSVRLRHRPTGIIRIATESRSQSANKLRAAERIREAIEARNRRPRPRIATHPTRASRERRHSEKVRGSKRKRSRSRVEIED
jgi:protein subunit release factor B